MSKSRIAMFAGALWRTALAALLNVAMAGQAQPDGAGPLPATHGKTVSGKPVTFPEPGHAKTLIVAGFSKSSSAPVKAWWELAEPLCKTHPEVACYRVAVLEEAPSFVHGMIVGGMRRDVPAGEQDHLATVFENESAWKKTFGFNAPDDAYLGLFDRGGKLLWHASGGEKAASSAALLPAFDAVR